MAKFARLVAAGLLFASLPLTIAKAQEGGTDAPQPAPVATEMLTTEMLAIDFDAGRLQGPGGDRLRAALADVQFIAVGEDHGFAGAPHLAAALAAEAQAVAGAGPLFHAVEVGPHTGRWASALLAGGGVAALDGAMDGRPYAMPFLANAEDAALARPFAAAGRLWGIDQEFVAAPAVLFDLLQARTTDVALRAQLTVLRDADRAALVEGRFGDMLMSTMSPAGFEQLSAGFADDAEARAMIAALAESAHIYQLNTAGRYIENNETRGRLMQAAFLDAWRSASPARPRVLFKLGLYHLGRGTTPTGIYDLGSLLPGLAAAQGQRSLHIAYVPVGGQVRVIRPGADGFTAVTDYADSMVTPILQAAGIDPATLPPTGHVLIPLQPLRYRLAGAAMRALSVDARFVLNGFDYLVTTRAATAATHFEAN